MSLKNTFNAAVVYQLHSNPAILGLYSKELGYAEIALRDLPLSDKELNALHAARNVTGTYAPLKKPVEFWHPVEGRKTSNWKVTSLKAK